MIHPRMPAIVAAGLTLALAGCQPDEPEAREVSAPDPSAVIATVDGNEITEVDLDAQIQAMAARGEGVDRGTALEELIDLRLLQRRAEREEIHLQPETAAEIRRQRAMLLANHLIRAEIDALDIDEDMLRAAYEDYVADAASRREYNARHILVDTRAEAEDVLGLIEDGGDFGELAHEHSTGPSGDRGGDLDWFRGDEVVDPFARAVADLAPGEYTADPVQTRFGWHIILLEDTREPEPEDFEDMRDQLRSRMVNAHIETFLRELRADSEIEIHDDSGD